MDVGEVMAQDVHWHEALADLRTCAQALRDQADDPLDDECVAPLLRAVGFYHREVEIWHDQCMEAMNLMRRHLDAAAATDIRYDGCCRWGQFCSSCSRPVLFFTEVPLLCETCRLESVCYFAVEPILDGQLPRQVRIGHTTQNVLDRLRDEGGLILVRIDRGSRDDEDALHARFAHLKCGNSRYRLEGALLEYLAEDLARLMRSEQGVTA